MKKIYLLFLVIVLLSLPAIALAQSYLFSLDQLWVDVFMNDDGTLDLLYQFTFSNAPGAAPIDFVDVGLPNRYFNDYEIQAEVDGFPAAYVSSDEFQGKGTGAAVALGSEMIPAGRSGTVVVWVPGVERMFHPDSQDRDYASMVFSPTWFDSKYVTGNTDVAVTFHFPPGVQPEEPRWHSAPPGWATEPETGFDNQGNITYTWRNSRANGYTQYLFGASLPRQYLPADVVKNISIWERLNINPDDLIGTGVCLGFILFFMLISASGVIADRRRRMQYLPPKISVEGHGIKRGLTAIEAAVLMQQPMDKILTMILFAVIKKSAASVKSRDPLELDLAETQPEGLHAYEIDFLNAFQKTATEITRQKELQNSMITLVRSVTKKMKGFSLKETVAYYKDITERAWAQVEAAETPEVKSAKYDEVMEWTMLDRDYDDRTRRVFTGGPVYAPTWWGHYDPGYPRSAPVSTGKGSSVSMPHLPGSDFAASMVNSVQNFSGGVIGSLGEFTGAVTSKTNPPPKTSSSGRGSSGGGGCACACAGCACACAGGGR